MKLHIDRGDLKIEGVWEEKQKAYIITEAPLRVTIYSHGGSKSFHEHAGELHVNISKKEFTMTQYMKMTSLIQNLERENYRDKKKNLLTEQMI